jgi:hypothetical protein
MMYILAIVAVIGLVALTPGGALAATIVTGTKATELLPLTPGDRWARVQGIILDRLSVVAPGFDPRCAYLMADMENGIAEGMLTATFQATNSLYNRHKGRTWTGPTYYASAADPDLRVFDSLESSVDDFIQLMNDPLYRDALQAALDYDVQAYINAVAAVGYSAQADYKSALINRARTLGVA